MIRSALCLALFLHLTTAAPAQNDGFLIETIEFVGVGEKTATILHTELRLDEGRVYQEKELRQAQYRLERLRFVLRAELQLVKGSHRGAYKLLITVTETKGYFWALFAEVALVGEDYLHSNFFDDGLNLETRLNNATIGRRWFPGSHGELNLFISATPGLSYTHYNLFNRNMVSTLAIQLDADYGKSFSSLPEENRLTEVNAANSYGLTFSVDMPVSRNQWFGFFYQFNGGELKSTEPLDLPPRPHQDSIFRNHKSDLQWRWNTKNHPLFATAGSLVKGGLFLDREFRDVDNEDPGVPYGRMELNNLYAYISGETYLEQGHDRTIGLGLELRAGDHHPELEIEDPDFHPPGDFRTWRAFGKLLAARNILERRHWGKPRDYRFELEIDYWINRSSLEGLYPDGDFNRFKIRFGVTGRDDFGLYRISIAYTSTNEELWQ